MGVNTFNVYVIWGMTPTMIICLPLKIFPPYLVGQAPPQCKGLYLRSVLATTFEEIFAMGIRKEKNPSLWV